MKIRKDYPGGNIQINRIEENCVYLEQELRDTNRWWFYWNFCACGMEGKKVRFCFENGEVVGRYGPCKSTDCVHWEWAGADTVIDPTCFEYTFGENEQEVYFAFSIPYQTKDLNYFLDTHRAMGITETEFVKTEKGRSLRLLKIGNPESKYHIYFTCRHHACESTASYVLEGVMGYLLTKGHNITEKYLFHIIPMVDLDGVEEGDQGKGRYPHDHNCDYCEEPIYAYTKAMYEYTEKFPPYLVLDYHSPGKWGKMHDIVHLVNMPAPEDVLEDHLGELWEKVIAEDRTGDSISYHVSNNLKYGVDWHTDGREAPYSVNYFWRKGAKLSVSLEIPYFGKSEVYTQSNLRLLGTHLGKAVGLILDELVSEEEENG